jgi:hypothetical protein
MQIPISPEVLDKLKAEMENVAPVAPASVEHQRTENIDIKNGRYQSTCSCGWTSAPCMSIEIPNIGYRWVEHVKESKHVNAAPEPHAAPQCCDDFPFCDCPVTGSVPVEVPAPKPVQPTRANLAHRRLSNLQDGYGYVQAVCACGWRGTMLSPQSTITPWRQWDNHIKDDVLT